MRVRVRVRERVRVRKAEIQDHRQVPCSHEERALSVLNRMRFAQSNRIA